jgi:peptidase A4-like protein
MPSSSRRPARHNCCLSTEPPNTPDQPAGSFAEALADERGERRRPERVQSSPQRRARGRLQFGVVLTLLVAASVASAVLGKPADSSSPQQTLAGYASFERVRSVQGAWTVPIILGGPRDAVAATWIGAQAPGAFAHAPFIQVGVQEASSDESDSGYDAFWSDSRLSFHPENLFLVNAGDRITASLQLARGHWSVQIEDVTTGQHARFRTMQDTLGAFNQAEWFQEDVTDNDTHKGFPYPAMTPVTFTGLKVNSAQPTSDSLQSSVMTVGTETLNPSPINRNSFTVGEY